MFKLLLNTQLKRSHNLFTHIFKIADVAVVRFILITKYRIRPSSLPLVLGELKFDRGGDIHYTKSEGEGERVFALAASVQKTSPSSQTVDCKLATPNNLNIS